MIALAIFLFIVAIALVVAVVLEGGDPVALQVFDASVDTTVIGVFLAGVLTGLIALAGFAVLMIGIRRSQARRKEIEYLRQKVAEREPVEPLVDPDTGASTAESRWSGGKFGRRDRMADQA
ncbi:hypothetical protein G1H11_13005 [Phytoactinopolyspora alkaliphila]|uniref:LapA family protein n=1 Tax=Phytoactinopolyspora alkaliphila TaxID=1783498 RepID=A0A6N9YMT5_9ACTN|nr:hypothetical protein [Phytoactinopolyspora alkaliphila]NED96230.1 hypothetical protein [Phytoactinopolyspora alkaliphila]